MGRLSLCAPVGVAPGLLGLLGLLGGFRFPRLRTGALGGRLPTLAGSRRIRSSRRGLSVSRKRGACENYGGKYGCDISHSVSLSAAARASGSGFFRRPFVIDSAAGAFVQKTARAENNGLQLRALWENRAMTTEEFKRLFEEKRSAVESAILKYLPPADARPHIVHEAMRYSMEAGGKRIRPMLLLAAHDMFPSAVDPLPACVAIECLHTYSLIHDDLPCMDNSDLRRGKPTCHKKFDETMALLAGDALLTYSFRLLADAYKSRPEIAAGLVLDLADAGGSQKMIGGQVEDVLGERDGKMTPEKLDFIHHNKTAALITAAVTMGIRLADSYDDEKLAAAREIGKNIGLAFQVIDDILDVTSDDATMGKTTGLDAANEKMTYVSLYGVEKSREIAASLTNKAVADCEKLSPDCGFLKALILYMQNRIN